MYIANDPNILAWRTQQCGGGGGAGGESCGDRPIDEDGVDLPVFGLFQQCQEWCWAATITMVATYYGISVSECGLAQGKTGYPCCDYAACAYVQCNQPAQTGEMAQILVALGIQGMFVPQRLDPSTLEKELSNGRPVIVGYQSSFSGHVAVISGFRRSEMGTLYHVIDPWPDFGEFETTYDVISFGPQGTMPWSATFYRLSIRTDGCNPNFDPTCGCDES